MLTGANALVLSIMMGVSAGTFVYIAACEIIVEEFSISQYKQWKFLFYLGGVGVMVSVFYISKAAKG